MRALLVCGVFASLLIGRGVKRHPFSYDDKHPPVAITVGDVEEVKPIWKGFYSNPSTITPDRLATIKMVSVLKGQGIGERIGLAYDARIRNAPVEKQRYVFFWDQSGRCIQFFTVKGNSYVKYDGSENPLEELRK